jgi:hypothetical protein
MASEKKDENFDVNGLGSLSGIQNIISTAFSLPDIPIEPLPYPLILSGAALRPGLSATEIISEIIPRLGEANLPVGDVFADGPNSNELLIKIIIEEVVKALLYKSRVDVMVVYPAGTGSGIIR